MQGCRGVGVQVWGLGAGVGCRGVGCRVQGSIGCSGVG